MFYSCSKLNDLDLSMLPPFIPPHTPEKDTKAVTEKVSDKADPDEPDNDEKQDTADEEKKEGDSEKRPTISFLNIGDLFGFGGPPRNQQTVRKKKEERIPPVFSIDNIPAPHRIKEELDKYVIGHDETKKVLSVAVHNHYRRLEVQDAVANGKDANGQPVAGKDDEFADVDLGYIRDDGKEVIVNTPEKLNETLISNEKMIPGHIFSVGYSQAYETPAVYKIEIKTMAQVTEEGNR